MKILLAFLLTINAHIVIGSSAFFVNSESKIFAKNYDWKVGHGYIFKNTRGQKKFAYGWSGNNPASWISKYGSVTFNQFAKEFPTGGINEKGLVVEKVFLPNSVYPNYQSPSISDLEWIQYQLDNFETVKEVINHIEELTIYPLESLQYLLADRTGDAVIIDFLNGKVGIHYRKKNHIILTTESHKDSENYYLSNSDIYGKKIISNHDRFVHLKSKLENRMDINESNAFELLNNISINIEPYRTQWSVVYNLDNLILCFSSIRSSEKKKLNLNEMDFSDSVKVEIADIHAKQIMFKPYHPDISKHLFQKNQNIKELRIDESLLYEHFSDVGTKKIDQIFQAYYSDIILRFFTKEPKGLMSFVLMKKDNTYQPKNNHVKAGQFLVENKETIHVLYGIPRGEIFLACFQDPGFNGNFENKILTNPNNYLFLKQSDRKSGTVPKYFDTNLYIKDDTEIIVKIK
jgi:penicillin V acylase-like amidase (Ntn superfamily)